MELYLGVMSGTSLDGIDIALTDLSGQPKLLAHYFSALPEDLRTELLNLCQSGDDELARAALASNAWAECVAAGVKQLLTQQQLKPSDIRAIGSHGQTIRHEPKRGFSLQIGSPALLAERCGISVVADFRSRDIAAGGQGAPLVPAFHQQLFTDSVTPRALVNIGGFSNLSLLTPGSDVLGFDCGPGNALMDAWIRLHRGQSYDANGDWAANGTVNGALLKQFLQDPFFAQQGPKSTGREYFHPAWLQAQLKQFGQPLAAADIQATLCALTAHSISRALLDNQPHCEQLLICGGGAHNHYLRTLLQGALPQIDVTSTQALGVDPDWLEAMAFAWFAQCCLHGTPANRPAVTGARGLRILGAIYPA
ncbi:anhydro-N-acetylmuramic acid kinase [Atopomonas sediminilitoris]|uniref:anhydro-N-acetylmuramic acid kinase n=1 Tax=Atopomonas sediminilitoris TaxID=2919919 RepID=UPI001F4E7CA1|nr:anhydro-N-acetylmuramic acid kinase [Atopomonas sediminilitoris]MCJ8168543.1 anhydro-N-acetylmuramic acid kinase [Atopomonas sediminilitoris]